MARLAPPIRSRPLAGPPAGAAVVADLAGTLPSHLMSRYWIWADADRDRPGRQAAACQWLVCPRSGSDPRSTPSTAGS